MAVVKRVQKELMIFQSIGTNISRLSMIVLVNVVLNAGLLIFHTVAELRNSGKSEKFTKTCKIPQNLVEVISNTCLYNIFET